MHVFISSIVFVGTTYAFLLIYLFLLGDALQFFVFWFLFLDWRLFVFTQRFVPKKLRKLLLLA